LTGAVGERLVLKRAFPAAVADRTVERVVEQQELEVRDLRLAYLRARVLGGHDHPGRDRDGARRRELGLALDLHVALAARARRRQVRVIAKARDLHAD